MSSISFGIKSFWQKRLEVSSHLLLISISQFTKIRILTSLKYHSKTGRKGIIDLRVTRNGMVNIVSVYISILNVYDLLGRCTQAISYVLL